ncbi:MAG TPA: isoaspartyl peptidase/L-asparaginase [Bacteroidia bacterium]|nr:isoaspartyl peptidase/L-asparaginase [Bacteroidia bacterium]
MVIAIHGGAGVILRDWLTEEMERLYRQGLEESLVAGYAVLKKNGPAIEAVQQAVVVLEDNPLFNAGRGSVLSHEGRCEMDAAIMDGRTRMAGAAAGVTGVKNPVVLARTIMERSSHVMLCGKGAEEFAQDNGLIFEPPSYFITEHRVHQWEKVRGTHKTLLDHSDKRDFPPGGPEEIMNKSGTVGAVALDASGNLAAATSTGGMTNKRWGRVGDSPLIGAGTFADSFVAVSCTGHGEYFMRHVVAHEVSALVRYGGMDLAAAARHVIFNDLLSAGGEGGLIAVDREGNIATPFNTPGMYHGLIDASGRIFTGIFQ